MSGLLFWVPRVLALAYTLFLALFALDVFEPGKPAGQVLTALVMHLLPNALVLLVLALAWRRPVVGAVVYPALGLAYIRWAVSRHMHWSAHVAIAGPLLLLGVLFAADACLRSSAAPPH
ncbi:MAG: hypothetical protein HZB16_04260 [Armatimonadetes bacterium]|nr:hypothetical protein [Armatimonadota bacterium]